MDNGTPGVASIGSSGACTEVMGLGILVPGVISERREADAHDAAA